MNVKTEMHSRLSLEEGIREWEEMTPRPADRWEMFEVVAREAIEEISAGRRVENVCEEILRDILEINISVPDMAWRSLLIAEAMNWASKEQWGMSSALYALKPYIVKEAAEAATLSGWGADGDIFYLFHEEAGEVSFHDPYGELKDLLGDEEKYPHQWCGVERQHLSHEILGDDDLRKEIALKARPSV